MIKKWKKKLKELGFQALLENIYLRRDLDLERERVRRYKIQVKKQQEQYDLLLQLHKES